MTTQQPTLLQLADEYARDYFMGREYDARKRLQAAIIVAETDALKAEQKAVADEREACAKLISDTKQWRGKGWVGMLCHDTKEVISVAIRARSNQPVEPPEEQTPDQLVKELETPT